MATEAASIVTSSIFVVNLDMALRGGRHLIVVYHAKRDLRRKLLLRLLFLLLWWDLAYQLMHLLGRSQQMLNI